jgi:AraC family transcriptional regulator
MERSEDKEAVSSSLAGPNFDHLANSLAQLLKTARRELEAKASLVTASSILQLEIEHRSRDNTTRTSALVGWQIVRVQAFIEKNLDRTIHTRDLSAVARRSPAHFSRSFKRAFGETPHAYVMRRRLEKACYLMMTSTASLSEIALSAGFSDQAHLCRLFRQAFGQAPNRWRREYEVPRRASRKSSASTTAMPGVATLDDAAPG